MKATVVDLRYRMKDVLKALERNEEVSVLYHGKVKGVIKPVMPANEMKVRDHAFFSMSHSDRPVEKQMEDLRGGRCRAL